MYLTVCLPFVQVIALLAGSGTGWAAAGFAPSFMVTVKDGVVSAIYSQVAKDYDPKKVWGVDGDADAFMRGIAQWLTTHERWNTPLYLYGESYGTMR